MKRRLRERLRQRCWPGVQAQVQAEAQAQAQAQGPSTVRLSQLTVAEMTLGLRRPTPGPMRPCGLPGCDRVTDRDYCSAEHCRQHRRQAR